ncbi:MAG: DEAD/DEAH box helicase [Rhodospirillales bacterium]|nr:DEAD/DEAH box helicase [Rhodospirillales bacterium]
MLKCASFLAHSKKSQMQDMALRIAQFCLQNKDVTTDTQKNSAQFVLNVLANRRAITLAKDKNLLGEKSEEWQKTFLGNLNWIKQEVEHSVWLKNGARLNVNVFQRSFWEALNTYRTLSVSAPTSAGKSHLIKQWILELVAEQPGCSIVYVVPTRALIAEVEADFQSALSEEIKASKVNVTSFPFIRFTDDAKPCIFILTQERLQLLLQRAPRKTDVLIVDEAYKLADDDRGILLQHVIERVTLINPAVKTVYISPLASNPEVLIDESEDNYSERYEDVTVNQNLICAMFVIVVRVEIDRTGREALGQCGRIGLFVSHGFGPFLTAVERKNHQSSQTGGRV